MRIKKTILFLAFIPFFSYGQDDSTIVAQIFNNALNSYEAYSNLEELTTKASPRELGSEKSNIAVNLLKNMFDEHYCDTIYLQSYTIDAWQHIGSSLEILDNNKNKIEFNAKAIGPSVATNHEGITNEIIEVSSIDGLQSLEEKEIEGKIIFINNPMNNSYVDLVDAYVDAVQPRLFGANEASKLKASAIILRSISTVNDNYVHTGCLRYNDQDTKIPVVVISTKEADLLSDVLKNNKEAVANLKVSINIKQNFKTYNVIAEKKGTTFPDEVIAIGAHIDTWYNTPGVHDDGAGCVQMIDVLRIFKELKIKNKRTIRVILFMDEEMFTSGATAYVNQYNNDNEKFIAAIESDLGAFQPEGFLIDGTDNEISSIKNWSPVLKPYGIYNIKKGFGGGDMIKLKQKFGFPSIALKVNSQRYFEIIHTEKDIIETVNRRELQMGSASITSLVYLIDKYGFEN